MSSMTLWVCAQYNDCAECNVSCIALDTHTRGQMICIFNGKAETREVCSWRKRLAQFEQSFKLCYKVQQTGASLGCCEIGIFALRAQSNKIVIVNVYKNTPRTEGCKFLFWGKSIAFGFLGPLKACEEEQREEEL